MLHLRWKPGLGMTEDLKNRLPLYFTDFSGFLNIKVVASIVFIFFANLGPALTFGSLLYKSTSGMIGIVEVLASTAIGGFIIALFAGQPFVIVGIHSYLLLDLSAH
jgi:hypothetical protein